MKKVIKTKVVELDEPVNSKPVSPSDLFSNGDLWIYDQNLFFISFSQKNDSSKIDSISIPGPMGPMGYPWGPMGYPMGYPLGPPWGTGAPNPRNS